MSKLLKRFIEQERGGVKHLSLSILCHELRVNYEVLKILKVTSSNALYISLAGTLWSVLTTHGSIYCIIVLRHWGMRLTSLNPGPCE